MTNVAVIVGRATTDIELMKTKSGKSVTRFNVAVDRNYTNANNEREADFISVQAWGKDAENIERIVGKGTLLSINGELQTSMYQKSGINIKSTVLVIRNWQKLSSGKSNANSEEKARPSSNDPFADNSKPIDISDDELPF